MVEVPASETTAERRYRDMFRRRVENLVREIEYELAVEHFKRQEAKDGSSYG